VCVLVFVLYFIFVVILSCIFWSLLHFFCTLGGTLVQALSLLVNSCLLTNNGKPKSEPKTDIKNYRPISLLCILSKLLERLIYDKIIDKIINLVSPVQFGFVRGRSSLQQMLLFINSVVEAHELSTPIDAIYLVQ